MSKARQGRWATYETPASIAHHASPALVVRVPATTIFKVADGDLVDHVSETIKLLS